MANKGAYSIINLQLSLYIEITVVVFLTYHYHLVSSRQSTVNYQLRIRELLLGICRSDTSQIAPQKSCLPALSSALHLLLQVAFALSIGVLVSSNQLPWIKKLPLNYLGPLNLEKMNSKIVNTYLYPLFEVLGGILNTNTSFFTNKTLSYVSISHQYFHFQRYTESWLNF